MVTLNSRTLEFLLKELEKPHRHYRNSTHVHDILDTINEYETRFCDCDAAVLAAWFHDAVYEIDDGYKYNEQRSCLAFLCRMDSENLEFYLSENGRKSTHLALMMIGCTQGHTLDIIRDWHSLSSCDISDIKMFLDADLRILSRDRALVIDFEEKIRKEFSIYDDIVYNQGRKAVLQSFLDRPKIYFSEIGEQWEEVARSNLHFLIERLS